MTRFDLQPATQKYLKILGGGIAKALDNELDSRRRSEGIEFADDVVDGITRVVANGLKLIGLNLQEDGYTDEIQRIAKRTDGIHYLMDPNAIGQPPVRQGGFGDVVEAGIRVEDDRLIFTVEPLMEGSLPVRTTGRMIELDEGRMSGEGMPRVEVAQLNPMAVPHSPEQDELERDFLKGLL